MDDIPDQVNIVDSFWVRMYPKLNGVASVVELVSGVMGGNAALAVDGMHGSAEIGIANTQINHAHEHDHIEDKQRRIIYTSLSGLALAAAGVAAAETTGALEWGTDDTIPNVIGWFAASAAAISAWTASTSLVHRIRMKYGQALRAPLTETEHDISRHIILLDTPSSTLAFMSASARLATLFANSKGYAGLDTEVAEHYIGIASGMYGAYLFRPTKSNLEHHSHKQSHETLPPSVEEMELARNLRQRLSRKVGKKALNKT